MPSNRRTASETQDPLDAQAGNPDFVLSLARGLRVIESFEGHVEGRTIVEIAHATDLSRASVRRILLTLEVLGYVEHSRQVYRLRTQVLRLGFSFLSSSSSSKQHVLCLSASPRGCTSLHP
jgi:IclR family pca regulon transcriptional regulator